MKRLFFVSLILSLSVISTAENFGSIKSTYEFRFIQDSLETENIHIYFDSIIEQTNDSTLIRFCILQKALLYEYRDSFADPQKYLDIYLQMLGKKEESLLNKAYYNSITGHIKYWDQNYIEAEKQLETSAQSILSNNFNDKYLELYTIYRLGFCAVRTQNFNKTVKYLTHIINKLENKSINSNYHLRISYLYKAIAYNSLENLILAKKYFYKSLEDESNSVYIRKNAYRYLASINNRLGIYDESIDNSKYALASLDPSDPFDYSLYSLMYNRLAVSYHYINELDTSIKYYNHSLKYSNNSKPDRRIMTLRNITELYFEQNDLVNSNFYLNKTLELLPKVNIRNKAHISKYVAEHYLKTNKLNNAFLYIKDAISLSRKLQSPKLNLAESYLILSRYYHTRKLYNEALISLDSVNFYNTRQEFEDQNISPVYETALSKRVLYKQLIFRSEILSTQLEFASNDEQKKLLLETQSQLHANAIDVVNKLRKVYSTESGKHWIAANYKNTYELFLEVTYKLHKLTNDHSYLKSAFELCQNSKSGILMDRINEDRLKNIHQIPDSLLLKERSLEKEKEQFEFELFVINQSNPESDSIQILNELITEIDRKLVKNVYHLSDAQQQYAKDKLQQANLSIDSLQMSLERNGVILEYYFFNNSLFSSLISKDTLLLTKQIIDENFRNDLDTVVKYVKWDKNACSHKKFVLKSHNLYKTLILPYEQHIKGRSLTIIPDDELLELPFEVLVTDNKNFTAKPSYLVFKNDIGYHYTSKLLDSDSQISNNKILAFAPNYKDNSDTYIDLKYNKEEVDNIRSYFPTKSLADKKANISAFNKNYTKYDIIHLAMHAQINNDNPAYSHLIFTPDQEDDFKLYTKDLYNLPPGPRHIVLSACNSGSGSIKSGEGIMSFARALIISGCPSLTLTLWTVNDKTSAELMNYFYANLEKNLSTQKVLQQAKIEYLKNADPLKSHPYYWSGYISMGEEQMIKDSKNGISYVFYILIFSVLIIVSISIYKKRKA